MDTARSWVVALSCCWINIFTFFMYRVAATIYVGILDTFQVSREEASWPINLAIIFYCVLAPIAGVLARHVAIWKMIFAGSIVASLSVCACFFANGIPFILIFMGVLHGSGGAFLSLCPAVINQHFERYRATANGLSQAGLTIGGIILPPLGQFFFDEYHLRGACLLMGACALNAAAGALVQCSSPSRHRDTKSSSTQGSTGISKSLIRRTIRNSKSLARRTTRSSESDSRKTAANSPSHEVNAHSPKRREAPLPDNSENHREANIQDAVYCERFEKLNGESMIVLSPLIGEGTNGYEQDNAVEGATRENSAGPKGLGTDTSVAKNNPGVFSFLKLPMFYVIAFSFVQITFNMISFGIVAVDLAKDRNFTEWDGVFLVMIYTAGDLVARLGSGWITDRGILTRSTMMGMHVALWAASLFATPLCWSYPLLVLACLVGGWCGGVTVPLTAVLLMDLVDSDHFSVCYGVASLLTALPAIARPFLIGYFKDTLGDYEGLFYLMGVLSVIVATSWIWVSFRAKWQHRRERIQG